MFPGSKCRPLVSLVLHMIVAAVVIREGFSASGCETGSGILPRWCSAKGGCSAVRIFLDCYIYMFLFGRRGVTVDGVLARRTVWG